MKVMVVAVSSTGHLSGIPRHAVNIVLGLLTCSEISEINLVAAEWQMPSLLQSMPTLDPRLRLHPVFIAKSSLKRNFWYYFELPKLALALEPEIVHLAYPVPHRNQSFTCPVVVSLHDLYPYDIPANFGFPKVFANRIILRQCLCSVNAIACVSESTARRLEEITDRSLVFKTKVVYNSVDLCERTEFSHHCSAIVSTNPFILCVAQHRRNKNICFALEIFRELISRSQFPANMLLVLIGMEGPETRSIQKLVQLLKLEKRVVFLCDVSDAELGWFYDKCRFLLAPSLVEGFGMPIVEAIIHGTQVVCSDIAAFREVGASYCNYVPLDDSAEQCFVDTCLDVLDRPPLPVPLVERFSLAHIAQSYLDLYECLIAEGKERGWHGAPARSVQEGANDPLY
ncbi:glycosyltransferase family 4 protein [Granulicella arctica]|uniref:glycosyltransferase family 4 protein n=1 Tax=Granulicella arctica TaxID=940613 RepID=UPI0021E080A9|nr:glycosyltransferase family 1 protein [Granulicella arctica]